MWNGLATEKVGQTMPQECRDTWLKGCVPDDGLADEAMRWDRRTGRCVDPDLMDSRANGSFEVLIVEDEALLALDVAMIVEDAGHRVVAEAASLHEVERLDLPNVPNLALVDVQLAENTSGFDVCRLVQRRWPDTVIVFVTANPLKIPNDYCGAHGVIPKPFSRNGLLSAMRYLEEMVLRPPPQSARPPSFIASPMLEVCWSN